MPLYKYQCTKCLNVFEDLVSSSAPNPPCPRCNSAETSRMISLISSKGLASGCADCNPSQCSSKGKFT